MSEKGEGKLNPAPVKPIELLKRAAAGDYTPQLTREPGITDDGRYIYRWDDEGRFWSRPFSSRDAR